MNLEFLKSVLAVQTYTGQETLMVRFIQKFARKQGWRVTRDHWNNVYVTKSLLPDGQSYPCFAAHIDTVCPIRDVPTTIVQREDHLIALDETGEQVGCGADDKGGVAIVLQLLARAQISAAKAIFFGSEECGSVGARHSDENFFDDVGYVLCFDAHGFVASHSCGSTELFANDGDFIRRALPVMSQHNLTEWQSSPFTDAAVIRRKYGISCLNLPAGYWNWHRSDEYLSISEVTRSLACALDIVLALGRRAYPYVETLAKPPMKIVSIWDALAAAQP